MNHQFDKSLKWEAALRSYLGRLSSVSYVSPLQPLWDLQVAGVFCSRTRYGPSTRYSGPATTRVIVRSGVEIAVS